MKKSTLLILTLFFLFSVNLFSQTIPNGDFENWTTVGGVLTADNWSYFSPECVTKDIGHNSNSSVKLSIVTVQWSMTTVVSQSINISSRPYSFNFYYKSKWEHNYNAYMAYDVRIDFTKNGSSVGMFDWGANYIFSYRDWTLINQPIDYFSNDVPDKAKITFTINGINNGDAGSFWLDDMSFQMTDVEELYNPDFHVGDVYPMPSSGQINIPVEFSKSEDIFISINDITGKKIKDLNYDNSSFGKKVINLDLSNLDKGMYFINLENKNHNKITKKVILN